MQRLFSTRDVHPRDRLAYWQDVACKTFVELQCKTEVGTAFDATIWSRRIADLGVSIVETDPCDVSRSRRDVRRSASDDVLLSLQLRGVSTLAQDGREARLAPGDFALYDTMRPYTLKVGPGVRQLVLKIPRRAIEPRLGRSTSYVARPVRGAHPLGGFASGFLRLIPERGDTLDRLDARAAGDLSRQTLDLITLAMLRCVDQCAATTPSRGLALARLKATIEAGLADHELSPAAAAAAAELSVRYANELLAEEGTALERYILERRLERCAGVLRDPRQDHRAIGDIAFACGFADASHMGRRFKQRFGATPRDYRTSRGE